MQIKSKLKNKFINLKIRCKPENIIKLIFVTYSFITHNILHNIKNGGMIMKTIGVIGGDLRQLALAKDFKNDDYNVYTYGLGRLDADDNEKAFHSDIIILPLPVCTNEKLNMPFSDEEINITDLLVKINKDAVIFGGKFPKWLTPVFDSMKITYFDYLNRPEFPVYNALPTAEGALEIAISETPYTINGSKVLITGYGNISKALSKMLKNLGADIHLAIRNKQQSAEAECQGFKVYHPNDIINHADNYDIIFNTVPAMLFSTPVLEKVSKEALIIDLASKPGGVDFESARLMSKRVIWALSLPGKYSPVSAGLIVKKTILNILHETEGI